MGKQVSRTAGLLDQAVQRREMQQQRRQKQKQLTVEQTAAAREQRAAEVKQSRETREFAGVPEASRAEAAEAYRTNINERQKIKEMAADSVSPGEAVRQMYGLDNPLQVLQQNNARQDDLRRERDISIGKQKATIKAARDERARTNAIYEAGNAKDLEDNLARQAQKIRDLERDLNLAEERKDKEALAEISEEVGFADTAKTMLEDIEADLVKIEQSVALEDKAQAKLAARDVAMGEEQLKKAFASRQFARRQVQANKPKDTTDGVFEEKAIAPEGEPETTLGLVASNDDRADTKEARETKRRADTEPGEPVFLTPDDIRMDTVEALEETRVKVAEALEKVRNLGSEAEEVGQAARKVTKLAIEKLDASVPGERLPAAEEAAESAREAARITIEDPVRAIQSQALVSVDTAMRVLR